MTNNQIKPRVLIAEDEAALGSALKHGLEADGFAVTWVKDGEAAIRALRDETPAIALLDIMMPAKDGFGVLDYMHSDARYADIPVMVLTNYGYGFMREKAVYQGVKDYFLKTGISMHDVIYRVRELLNLKQPYEPSHLPLNRANR